MTVEFELDGQPFTALNGGPVFKFNEAISFQVICETQEEIDSLLGQARRRAATRRRSSAAGSRTSSALSWQVVPDGPGRDARRTATRRSAERAMEAMLQMKKLDIAELERAYKGVGVGV